MTEVNAPQLRLAFAGTPHFAATILAELAEVYPIVAVYSQPARAAGRGRKVKQSPVEILARQRRIEVHTPLSIRSEASKLAALELDALVVAAYGKILPKDVLNVPRFGCINVHASLLPRWRGAAPIERAMLAGDEVTGISIMQMEEGLDTGPLLHQAQCPIFDNDTGDTLHERLAALGARTLIACLGRLGTLTARSQSMVGVTYAPKLTPNDSQVDWCKPARAIAVQIRALNSRQPAVCYVGGERLRLLFAEAVDRSGSELPGTVVSLDRNGLVVATGSGAVRISRVALSRGKGKPMDIASLMNGYPDLLKLRQVLDASE
jgi:methionyl-tRNA formyltransferase